MIPAIAILPKSGQTLPVGGPRFKIRERGHPAARLIDRPPASHTPPAASLLGAAVLACGRGD
jgi:hypothetical protein